MIEILLSRVTDWDALGEQWRELEARSHCSFFQTWTWMGCLAAERFDDPVVLHARQDARLVAMGLFNRSRRRLGRKVLWLGETGVPAWDSVFVEWNGLLTDAGTGPGLLAKCLRTARHAPIGSAEPRLARRVVLSGVDTATVEASRQAGLPVTIHRTVAAPYIDLARLRQASRHYLDALSGNTRYQLRRSERAYAAAGDLVLTRAANLDRAFEFLDALVALHQATWTTRGRPGAFAERCFVRFHRALIERGLERGEIALLRLAVGDRPVGFLYNFETRGTVLAYQSGFDYSGAGRHQTPGLTCHHLAIEDAASRGLDRYDFLAGDDRYKTSLATSADHLHWAELGEGWSPRRTIRRIRYRLAR
jgi:CelD/BcsL family acetyltransferase involved in cellulose biosynthesis